MAPAGITVIKSFEYRGVAEEWSNQYHISEAGTDPASWATICDALITLEKHCYSDRVTVLRCYCYEDTDDASVYTYDLAAHAGVIIGALDSTHGITMAGDAAGWIRWDTGRTSSSGKKIYLRKYYHDVHGATEATPDTVFSDWITGYNYCGSGLLSAFSGSVQMVGPDGNPPSGATLSGPYVTTRTLKRRGRRP